jgi:hypothetical protein
VEAEAVNVNVNVNARRSKCTRLKQSTGISRMASPGLFRLPSQSLRLLTHAAYFEGCGDEQRLPALCI